MASVTAPLLSLSARGTVGGAIVFGSWKGRATVRRHARPANPQSAAQLSVRAMMRFLAQYWASLTSVQQASWDTRAAVTNVSAFNAFVQYNMHRWGTNDLPSKLDPAAESNTAGVLGAFTATAQSRSVLLSITVDTLNDNWGINLFRGLAADMGVTRNELIRTIPAESAATFTFLDVPLTVGTTYYYRAYPFSDDGVIGAALDDINATPTA